MREPTEQEKRRGVRIHEEDKRTRDREREKKRV